MRGPRLLLRTLRQINTYVHADHRMHHQALGCRGMQHVAVRTAAAQSPLAAWGESLAGIIKHQYSSFPLRTQIVVFAVARGFNNRACIGAGSVRVPESVRSTNNGQMGTAWLPQ